jgi:hypothetical protein
VPLGVTQLQGVGIAPNGDVLFAAWRSTTTDAGPAGHPIVIYDPSTKKVTGEFGSGNFSSGNVVIHACGTDVCTYDNGFGELSRYDSGHARTGNLSLGTVLPSNTSPVGAGITDAAVAYVLYSDGTSLGVMRVAVP